MTNWASFLLMLSALMGEVAALILRAGAFFIKRLTTLPIPPLWIDKSNGMGIDHHLGVSPAVEPTPIIKLDGVEFQRGIAIAVQTQTETEATAVAQFDGWLVSLGAEYDLWRATDLESLKKWVALVLHHVQTQQDCVFPVKPTWKLVKTKYGATTPDKRLISYQFFWRLNETLIAAELITRGRPGVAAQLNADKLPG